MNALNALCKERRDLYKEAGYTTVRLPFPHAGQIHVRRTAKRFNVLSAGRRWRKTTLCAALAIEYACRGAHVVWGAPTFDQVYTAWEEMIKAAGHAATFSQTRMTAWFYGAGQIQLRSLDQPDNARGKTADVAVIDEAADVAAPAWFDVIRPMLIDTNGIAWIIGTPKGRNWFYREFKRGEMDPAYACWNAPTRGCRLTGAGPIYQQHRLENPTIPFSEIRTLWETMPERSFRQEIMAEFVEDGGGVFRNVQGCVRGIHGEDTPQPKAHYIIGIDWGRSNDFTVFVVIDDKKRVVQIDRFTQIGFELQKGRLAALYDKWSSQPLSTVEIIAEENSIGGPLIEALNSSKTSRMHVVPFITTLRSKEEVIQDLSLRIERGHISYPKHVDLLEELEAYTATTLPSGGIRYSAPEGSHDDCVMALAIASHHAFSQTTSYEAPVYGRNNMSRLRAL